MKHALVLLRLNGKKSEKYLSKNNEKIVKVCLRLIEDLQYIYFRSVLVNDMQPGLPLKTFFENVQNEKKSFSKYNIDFKLFQKNVWALKVEINKFQ